jgi:S-(hydroxymethyl)glutathione dehydrogenase/alcohol dehydrogenase
MPCRVVESVGEDVNEVSEGDTVIPTFVSDCGECVDCRSTKSNLCSKLPFKVSPFMPRYETSRFTDLNGEVLHHFLSVSSFSEYTVVDISHVTKIDSAIPLTKAAGLLGCGVSTGTLVIPYVHWVFFLALMWCLHCLDMNCI